jgi:hypothetical protein
VQPLQCGAQPGRELHRPALAPVDEHVHEPAGGQRLVLALALAEEPDLVADARAPEVPDAQPGLDRLGKRECPVVGAMGLGAQPDDVAMVDV